LRTGVRIGPLERCPYACSVPDAALPNINFRRSLPEKITSMTGNELRYQLLRRHDPLRAREPVVWELIMTTKIDREVERTIGHLNRAQEDEAKFEEQQKSARNRKEKQHRNAPWAPPLLLDENPD